MKKASIITKLVIAILIIYILVTLVTLCVKIEKAKAEKEALTHEAAEIAAGNDELQHARDDKDNDEVIGDIARDKLGLVDPDEEIFYGN